MILVVTKHVIFAGSILLFLACNEVTESKRANPGETTVENLGAAESLTEQSQLGGESVGNGSLDPAQIDVMIEQSLGAAALLDLIEQADADGVDIAELFETTGQLDEFIEKKVEQLAKKLGINLKGVLSEEDLAKIRRAILTKAATSKIKSLGSLDELVKDPEGAARKLRQSIKESIQRYQESRQQNGERHEDISKDLCKKLEEINKKRAPQAEEHPLYKWATERCAELAVQ